MPPLFLHPRLADYGFSLSSSSSPESNTSDSASSTNGTSGTTPAPSEPQCPESPSSGAFSDGCTPVSNSYPSPYSPGQLAVIGFVSCVAVLVAAAAFFFWVWKWRRRTRATTTTTAVSLGTSPPANVPQTVRIPKSAFARRAKRVNLQQQLNGSEHELQPARNPDGTLRDQYDEEGLDTMATFETGFETLVQEDKPEQQAEAEGKIAEGKEGEVPLSIQRLTLGPLPLPDAPLSPPAPAPPSPTYHPEGNRSGTQYAALSLSPASGSVPSTPMKELHPPSS
ncbi:hypothetical protein CALVIDRAFT_146058 [Calocera viscosa TUFC12733]|uniref:Uncharacterized protein n=1 Tax=Calocera viscosa (strain TUFC12733) TaxID=1330018 RepID=A0A167LT52_CALVF|nr:hypothetical protein CALVIDRAFT_146058 [Calocera viscosa TUFC12733]